MALDSFNFEQQNSFSARLDRSEVIEFNPAENFNSPQHAVETIETIARFEEIENDWNSLFDRASQTKNVFQSFNWHWHWCRHYLNGNDTSLRIVAVWEGARLVMIWPLIVERSLGVRQLKWMGAPVSQYGDILIDDRLGDNDLIDQVWSYIVRHIKVDLIALGKVCDDSPIAALLKSKNAIKTECLDAPYLDLKSAESYDEYQKRYSNRSRKNRRRHRRRLGDLGAVEFKVVETGEEAGDLVTQTIDTKRHWLKEKGIISRAYSDPTFDAFFIDVARSINHPCGCLVSVISSEGKPVGFDVGFQSGDNYVAHIGAYDLDYERFSVGSLLMEDFLGDCYARGIKHFDFLAPNAPYKASWADDCISVCDYDIPLNGRGYLYAKGVNGFLRNTIKMILKKSPDVLRKIARPLLSSAG